MGRGVSDAGATCHVLGLAAGEITDKGYVNQRGVLKSRRDLVDELYADNGPPRVVICA